MIRNMLKIVFLLLWMPMICNATSLVFTEDGTIAAGTYNDVTIMDTATVSMTGGIVGDMYIQNLGKLNFEGGSINQVELRDSSTLNLEGATFDSLQLFNSSVFNLNSGTFNGWFQGGEYIEIIVNGGQVINTQVDTYGYAVIDIYGGEVTWDFVRLHGYSVLNVYGGSVSFNNGFNLYEDGEINVYYSSIIHREPGDPYSEIIGYHLRDSGEFMLDQFTQAEIDQINFVPEPTTFLLFGLGYLFLKRRV